MGTRYNISLQDIKKAGLVVQYREDTQLYHVVGGICGWDFSSYGGKDFSGPNIGKPELNWFFKGLDITPEYY